MLGQWLKLVTNQLFFCGGAVSRQGFSVAVKPVLELALVDQAGLELRDPPASAS